MKPKAVELILIVTLIAAGVFAKNGSHDLFYFILLFTGLLLSFYYLIFYGNDVKGKTGLLNLFVRWVLALFPVAFSMMFINAHAGRIVMLVYFGLSIMTVILKSIHDTPDKYEIIRMYIFIVTLSVTSQCFD